MWIICIHLTFYSGGFAETRDDETSSLSVLAKSSGQDYIRRAESHGILSAKLLPKDEY